MIDDFFQKKPFSPSSRAYKRWGAFIFRSLFYTSLSGFILGIAIGYLHIRGWLVNAEESLLLYGVTFGIGALLSTSFVLYQLRHNKLKASKIKVSRLNH